MPLLGLGADGAGGDAALLPPPGGAQQRGDSVLLQRSGGGKGVAGQAEYQLAAQRCRQHGAAGLLGYPLHHKLCTQLFQHKGQIILLPYGDAAAGDDGIAAGQQLLHFTGDDLRVVGALLPFHGKAQLTQPGGVLDAVGIVNFTGCPRCAGCQQLAAGGKDAHGQRSADGYFGVALPCQHAQMGGGEHRPGRRDDRTGSYIFPPEHDVLQRLYGSIELYGLFAAVGQLLHQNAVRALRQGSSGHDAGSAACGQRRSRSIARVKLHHHRQGDRGLPACTGSIRAVQGVAVQRAAVKGGLVHPGAEVGGSNAPAGGFQRDGLWGEGRSAAASSTLRSALTGEQKGWFIITSSIDPPLSPSAMAQTGTPAGVFFFQKRQVKKKRRRLDRKIKTPPQNIPTKPAAAVCSLLRRWQPLAMRRPCSGSLQAATPREPLPFPLLQQREGGNAPERWMGGVLFFKLQRFFCGKAVGFPPPPLNARPCGCSIAARCPALCESLDAFAQRSSYTLIQL